MKNNELAFEIDNLNLDDLDVQELEARLELAVCMAPMAAAVCDNKEGECGTKCSQCSNCYGKGCG